MKWDYCVIYTLQSMAAVDGKPMEEYGEGQLRAIAFYLAERPSAAEVKVTELTGFLGRELSHQEASKYPQLDQASSDTKKRNNIRFVEFKNIADAFVALGTGGWEAVSHGWIMDRFGSDLVLQTHEKFLFKRPVNEQ